MHTAKIGDQVPSKSGIFDDSSLLSLAKLLMKLSVKLFGWAKFIYWMNVCLCLCRNLVKLKEEREVSACLMDF